MDPKSLQLLVTKGYPALVDKLVDVVESLPNRFIREQRLFDTGLWVSEWSHFTIIYKSCADAIEGCTFEIKAHGRRAKELKSGLFSSSVSDELDFDELTDFLRALEQRIQS